MGWWLCLQPIRITCHGGRGRLFHKEEVNTCTVIKFLLLTNKTIQTFPWSYAQLGMNILSSFAALHLLASIQQLLIILTDSTTLKIYT
jgi:hypothetical protein